ncbi:polyketide synthase [Pseudoscourfieldia marina]
MVDASFEPSSSITGRGGGGGGRGDNGGGGMLTPDPPPTNVTPYSMYTVPLSSTRQPTTATPAPTTTPYSIVPVIGGGESVGTTSTTTTATTTPSTMMTTSNNNIKTPIIHDDNNNGGSPSGGDEDGSAKKEEESRKFYANLPKHNWVPAALRILMAVCSLLAFSLMASQISRDGKEAPHSYSFLLFMSVLLFIANTIFAVVECFIALDHIQTSTTSFSSVQATSSKVEVVTDWLLGTLGYGAACAAAGVTSSCRAFAVTQPDNTIVVAGGECSRGIAAVVFLFITLVACALPQMVWLVPTLMHASLDGGSQAPTALRWILGTRSRSSADDDGGVGDHQ